MCGSVQIVPVSSKNKSISRQPSHPDPCLLYTSLCSYGILDAGKTAVIEMSGAAGITLLSETERNPLYTTTYGVGEVIRDAISRGCRHFIIGIGGSATNDGGIGMLQALGFDLLDQEGVPVRHGALGLKDLAVISDSHALPELKECTFRIACDVTNPLCGPHGCLSLIHIYLQVYQN